MAFSVGIVGLPNVGKSTLFNTLTGGGAESANYPFCTIDPNVGVAIVSDPRLKEIDSFFSAEKVIPAAIEIVDIAGLVEGASKGEGLGNQFLSNVRNCTALMHVVRCFSDENVVHVRGEVDPLHDIETIENELILSDIESLEKRQQRVSKLLKSGDKEAKLNYELVGKLLEHLGEGKPAKSYPGSEDDHERMREYFLLSTKPMLYVANLGDDEGGSIDEERLSALKKHAAENQSGLTEIRASIEAEIASLDDEEERMMFLEELGLSEPGLARLSRDLYKLLGYQSYFTAGKKEVRAWTIKEGFSAPQAAGVIHSDFERGFIRAEVYSLEDLKEYKTEVELKKAGKLRSEGKDYTVKDGDIIHFLFNV